MKHPFRLALVAGIAIVGLAAFTADVPPETVVLESRTHTLTIDYLDGRGDYRRARVTLQPVRRGSRPVWGRHRAAFTLLGTGRLSRDERSRFERAGLSTTHILSSGFGSTVMVAPSRATLGAIRLHVEGFVPLTLTIPNRRSGSRSGEPEFVNPFEPPGYEPPADRPPVDLPPPGERFPNPFAPAPGEVPPPSSEPPADDDEEFPNPFGDDDDDDDEDDGDDSNDKEEPGDSTTPPTGNDESITLTF